VWREVFLELLNVDLKTIEMSAWIEQVGVLGAEEEGG
jgi:hypothetical protein